MDSKINVIYVDGDHIKFNRLHVTSIHEEVQYHCDLHYQDFRQIKKIAFANMCNKFMKESNITVIYIFMQVSRSLWKIL